MSDSDEIERAWRYYKQADDLQHRRHQLFLTVEGVLVGAFVASQNFVMSKSLVLVASPIKWLPLILAIVGFLFAALWGVVVWSVQQGMNFLREEVMKVQDPTFAEYLSRVSTNKWVTGRRVLNIYLAIVVMLVWVCTGAFGMAFGLATRVVRKHH